MVRLLPVIAGLTAPLSLSFAQAPVVTDVSATSAEHPGTVTIQGSDFGAVILASFDQVPATVLSESSTQITLQPQVGDPGFLDLTLVMATGTVEAPDSAKRWPALSATESGLGGSVDVVLENGEVGSHALAFSTGLLSAPIPLGPGIHFGVLVDPGATFGELGVFPVPGTGTHSSSFPIGSDPALLGLPVHLQSFAGQGAPTHDFSFSNSATVVIGASVPPTGLSYPLNPASYPVGQAIVPNIPTLSGWGQTFSVAPTLPLGLVLNPSNGTISGTPLVAAGSTDFAITASNPAGSTATILTLEVLGSGFRIELGGNAFDQYLPHQTLDPFTGQVVDLLSIAQLETQLASGAALLPNIVWPTSAILPDGSPGNHYVVVEFSEAIDIASVLDDSIGGGATSHLTGAITITGVDPTTGAVVLIPGQPFVDGRTYDSTISGTTLALETWVVADPADVDGDGILVEPVAVGGATPGVGFPGTESVGFTAALDALGANTFVYVFDTDGLLASHAVAPIGLQIRVSISTAVRSVAGDALAENGVMTLTVGPDNLTPEVQVFGALPAITPGGGDLNVDPETNITVQFTETVDLTSVGSVGSSLPPTLSSAAELTIGLPSTTMPQLFTVRPASVFDLSRIVLDPVAAFPGDGPPFFGCDDLNTVTETIFAGAVRDLDGNLNSKAASTFFSTGEGQGIVNAPVAPDTIYVGRSGATPSLSVVDLNGFGGGTGFPTYDILCPVGPDQSDYPNNPNVALQGAALIPPLSAGTCPINGGSDGVFTLTKDSNLNDALLRGAIGSVDDMALGWPLDVVFSNATGTCGTGGGNLCAHSSLQAFRPKIGGPNTLVPASLSDVPLISVTGRGNPISWAPSPNPPQIVLPELCGSPQILGQEPTSVDNTLVNLLVPGPNPLGNPAICLPPTSLLSPEQNAFFAGPSLPTASIGLCSQFTMRQQVGHFLYVVDRSAGQLLVLNSNRFTVLDRIDLPDPTRLAMSPNLDFVAVTNRAANSVSFVDIDPSSTNFHQVVKTTSVGSLPYGIAWETGNEDILVCNEGDGSVSVLSAFSFTLRKTLTNLLTDPFEVVTTPRQNGFGLNRNVYYAWILNRSGTISLFESGPDGVSGWGYDDVIGVTPFVMKNPQAIAADPLVFEGGAVVAHEDPLVPVTGAPSGILGAAVARIVLTASVHAPQPIDPTLPPHMRDLDFLVQGSIAAPLLTGVPTDIAFDNQRNFGSLPNYATAFSAGVPLVMNGKSLVKPIPGTSTIENANEPQFMFLAVPNSTEGPGVVQVFEALTNNPVDTNPFVPGVQSIAAPGATVLMDYFRQ